MMLSKGLAALLLIFLLFKSVWMENERGDFVIKVFDVGQGDAILIKTPLGHKIVIDGGGDYEVDRYMDKEFFLTRCEIDMLILTHPHQDHIKGLNRLLDRCEVGTLVFDPINYDIWEYDKWLNHEKNTKSRYVTAGETLKIVGEDFILVVVWPDKSGYYNHNINNSSVSVLLDYGHFEALFLGDLEKEASSQIELDLFDKYVDGNLEVYKVPHHGSTDSYNIELVNYLKPEKCLVSVGVGNKFDHPDEGVISALEESGCEVLRTDRLGTIEVLINSR